MSNYNTRVSCYIHDHENVNCTSCFSSNTKIYGKAKLDNKHSVSLYKCNSCSNVFNGDSPGVKNLKENLLTYTGADSVDIDIYQSNTSSVVADINDHQMGELKNELSNLCMTFEDRLSELTYTIKLLIEKNEELQEKMSSPMQGLRTMVSEFNLE